MFIQQRLLPSPGSVKLIQRTIIRRTLAASASNSSGSSGNGSKGGSNKTGSLRLTIINSSYEKRILLWKKDRLEEELSIVNKYLECFPEEKEESESIEEEEKDTDGTILPRGGGGSVKSKWLQQMIEDTDKGGQTKQQRFLNEEAILTKTMTEIMNQNRDMLQMMQSMQGEMKSMKEEMKNMQHTFRAFGNKLENNEAKNEDGEEGISLPTTVKVEYYKNAVLVTGAFDLKDELKDLGGGYNRQLKGWVFSKKKRDAVVKLVKESLPAGVDMVDETVNDGARGGTTTEVSEEVGEGNEDNAEQEMLANLFDVFSEGCPVDDDTVYWTDGLYITRTRKDGTPDGYYYSTE